MASAFTTNSKGYVQTTGFEKLNCSAGAQNIDGGYNCASNLTTTCLINGNTAYDTRENCDANGTTGILKHN